MLWVNGWESWDRVEGGRPTATVLTTDGTGEGEGGQKKDWRGEPNGKARKAEG